MHENELALDFTDHGLPAINVGRYMLHRQIARGGMATIHIARLMGDEGFSRIVAAKRLLPEFAEDPEFVAMFLDEARIASKVHHRNVVPVLDVVTTGEEVVLVQEYVHGAPLHWLLNKARQSKSHVPVNVTVAIAAQVLAGLHAAHETVDEMGMPLNIVHRDVSPQNVMVTVDGSARLLDFGVAKATMAAHITREGTYKGKLAYSAPEHLQGRATRQSDIYSLAVLLWELIVGHRMHRTAQGEGELIATIMNGTLPTITEALSAEREWESIGDEHWHQLEALEPVIRQGLAVDTSKRFQTAVEMEEALVAAVRPATASVVAHWLKSLGRDYLEKHDRVLAAEEASWRRTPHYVTGSRRTPPPGSLQAVRMVSNPGIEAVGSVSQPMAIAPPRKGPYALVALLSVLVVALAVGIVLVIKSTQPQAAPAVAAPAPAPARVPVAAPAPAVAAPAPAPVATSTPPTPIIEPPNEDTISIGQVETESQPAKREPAKKTVQRPPVRVQSRPAPAPTKPVPAAAIANVPDDKDKDKDAKDRDAPKDNCNPPYYFDGSKKVFKAACL